MSAGPIQTLVQTTEAATIIEEAIGAHVTEVGLAQLAIKVAIYFFCK